MSISSAATEALAALASGGPVEEYEIGRGKRRVKRGNPVDQVDAALKLSAIANRQSGGLYQKAVLGSDRS
ncbi:MAG TPA: hypothetical protein VLA12_24165 [Planctomycetaceae bacterium]|nr:hypothetical protein [Planctomycetaceae bacterium]HSG73533.1 hypothetical protein [Planctomycetaceae bacterium]